MYRARKQYKGFKINIKFDGTWFRYAVKGTTISDIALDADEAYTFALDDIEEWIKTH